MRLVQRLPTVLSNRATDPLWPGEMVVGTPTHPRRCWPAEVTVSRPDGSLDLAATRLLLWLPSRAAPAVLIRGHQLVVLTCTIAPVISVVSLLARCWPPAATAGARAGCPGACTAPPSAAPPPLPAPILISPAQQPTTIRHQYSNSNNTVATAVVVTRRGMRGRYQRRPHSLSSSSIGRARRRHRRRRCCPKLSRRRADNRPQQHCRLPLRLQRPWLAGPERRRADPSPLWPCLESTSILNSTTSSLWRASNPSATAESFALPLGPTARRVSTTPRQHSSCITSIILIAMLAIECRRRQDHLLVQSLIGSLACLLGVPCSRSQATPIMRNTAATPVTQCSVVVGMTMMTLRWTATMVVVAACSTAISTITAVRPQQPPVERLRGPAAPPRSSSLSHTSINYSATSPAATTSALVTSPSTYRTPATTTLTAAILMAAAAVLVVQVACQSLASTSLRCPLTSRTHSGRHSNGSCRGRGSGWPARS